MSRHLKTLDDLRPHMLDEIESFFTHYAGLNGKQLEVLARKGPRRPASCSGRREEVRAQPMTMEIHRQTLEEASTQVGGEAPMLLPGVQTMLGFQVMAVFNQRFETFSPAASRSCISRRSCWSPSPMGLMLTPGGLSSPCRAANRQREVREYVVAPVDLVDLRLS